MRAITRKIAEQQNEFVRAGLLRYLNSGQELFIFSEDEVPPSSYMRIGTCREGYVAKLIQPQPLEVA